MYIPLLVKRALDFTLARSAFAATAPVLAGVAAAIRLTMGKPVLFRQERPGLRVRPFTAHKFCTMRDATGADGRALPDAERLTAGGGFIRRTRLDELPPLWNVVRGDMRLVGPRSVITVGAG